MSARNAHLSNKLKMEHLRERKNGLLLFLGAFFICGTIATLAMIVYMVLKLV